jgi:hypothetical protein
MLTVASGLVGIGLGLRFKVFMLAAALAVAVSFIGIGGIVANHSAWSTLWAAAETSLALQTGYLIGIFGADVVAKALNQTHRHILALRRHRVIP